MASSQTLSVRPPVWAIFTAVLIGGCFYLGGKFIESRDPTPSVITVTGEGTLSAKPDIAELSFGVTVVRAATSQAAMQKLTDQMTAIVAAVKKAGIPDKDVMTEQFSLNPSYDWSSGSQQLRGYDASQMLRVKVRDLTKTSTVLGAATDAGANQAGNVQFTIDEPDALRAQARAEAIEQAREKAWELAAALGMRLGKLKGYNEDGGYLPPVMYGRGAMMNEDKAEAAPTPPLPEGEQDVRVGVSLTYELY